LSRRGKGNGSSAFLEDEVDFKWGNTEAPRREPGANVMDYFLEETIIILRVAR